MEQEATATRITTTFEKIRETKGTCLYGEVGEPEFHKVGNLYVKKATLNQLTLSKEFPRKIRVTLECAD